MGEKKAVILALTQSRLKCEAAEANDKLVGSIDIQRDG
jgi:hypothetical protein